MKSLKLSLVAAVAALVVVAAGPVVRADPFVLDGTYAFTADASDPLKSLDGSTVTFLGDAIVSWNLVDVAPEAAGFGLPLTTSNSSIISSGVFGPDSWFFVIGSPIGTPSQAASTFWFSGLNNLFGYSGALFDKVGDPFGTWGPARASVPDASSTFQLLAGALTALGAGRYLLFRRAATRS